MHNVKTVNTLPPEAPFMLNEEIKSIVHVYTSIVCWVSNVYLGHLVCQLQDTLEKKKILHKESNQSA